MGLVCAELIWETPPLQGGYGGTICPCSLFKSSSRRDAPSILHEEIFAKKWTREGGGPPPGGGINFRTLLVSVAKGG